MIGNNPSTQSSTITRTSQTVGAKLPAEVTKAHETASRVISEAQHLYPRDGLAEPVYAALRAGRDAATDPDVQRAYLAMQLGTPGITQQVENIASEEMRVVFAEHADAIVTAWSKPFGQAVVTLKAAFGRLGPVALSDTASVLGQGGDAADVWSKAQAAVTTIDNITGAWTHLADLTRRVSLDPSYPALRLITTDASTWRDLELTRRRIGPWEAITLGLTLSLPTLSEYGRRIQTIERGMADLAMAEAPTDRGREAVREWSRKMSPAR